MQVSEAITSGAVFVPWPVVVEGKTIDGHRMKISPVCKKNCGATPKCAATGRSDTENICDFGMSFYTTEFGDSRITIVGVRGPANPNTNRFRLKQELKGRSVTLAEIEEWKRGLNALLGSIEGEFLRRQSEMLDPLHDPIRLARKVKDLSHNLVQLHAVGEDLDEQVENASAELKSLVKAAELLGESFEFLAIFFNPEAAAFGKKTYTSLHGILRKLVSILGAQEMEYDAGHAPKIFLNGQTHRRVHVYESFKLVPLALISNAVKYSLMGNVRVDVLERANAIEVSVESFGPPIDPDETVKIFSKRGRGRWAEKVGKGTGVGLYLAKIVAGAHGFDIKVSSNRQVGKVVDGIPIALNRFVFQVSTG